MAKSKKSKSSRTSDSAEKKQSSRPTHFLCFPLARESTVPVFAKSMAYFREVSTATRRLPPIRGGRDASGITTSGAQDMATLDHDRGSSSQPEDLVVNHNDPLGNTQKPVAESSFIDSLKVLPDIVYRGAGTLHLTLGVMDLSKETEMQKATDLLHSLHLEKMLRDASEGPPAGMKSQRRWKDKRGESDNITSTCSDSNVIGQKETGVLEDELSVQVEQESDSVPKNTLGREQTPLSSKDENRDTDVKSLRRTVSPPTLARQPSTTTPSPKPLYLSLTGIKAFPSARKARVIWAQPRAQLPTPPPSELNDRPQRPTFDEKEGDRLYNFALHLHQAFKDASLVNETRQPVLHATLANMRYKVQAKGGRETKGKAWKYGKKRWEEGLVDIRPLAEVFNRFDGDVAAAQEGIRSRDAHAADVEDIESEDDEGEDGEVKNDTEARDDREREDPSKEYIWCKDIKVDRIAICKMGATKSEDPMWKEWYPPVVERVMFGEEKGG